MTIDRWLDAAVADARRRGLPALAPMLEGLAAALAALRRADFNEDASAASLDERGAHPPRTHRS